MIIYVDCTPPNIHTLIKASSPESTLFKTLNAVKALLVTIPVRTQL